jgi:hypothetical protein
MDARAVMEAMKAENNNLKKEKEKKKHRSESAPNSQVPYKFLQLI